MAKIVYSIAYGCNSSLLDYLVISINFTQFFSAPVLLYKLSVKSLSTLSSSMKLTLEPVEIPFMIGDTVWVDQPFGFANEFPFFQGTITQIILDGGITNSLLIRKRQETHELMVTNAVYSLKPVGDHAGSERVNVNVQLSPLRTSLFETREEIVAYQNQINE